MSSDTMKRFDGKVVLVTGGTRGIGRACVERFLAEGARVAWCGTTDEGVRKTQDAFGPDTLGVVCDVSDPEAVNAMVQTVETGLGPIDVLVNNAGISRENLVPRIRDDEWETVMRVNLDGVFYCCRAVSRGMIQRRRGRIINIASILGYRGQAGQSHYCASKAAVIGFSRALARELARRSITVNVVAPGYTLTDMTSGMTPAVVEQLLAAIPMNRAIDPAEVAAAVAFLASDEAAGITGITLPVDGGLTS
ncbi:MAG TPA: 3-oxoacyl-ACP reductase FabG [Candidatus Hydrogenedentes bacterium]|nr:3-oxoacyl-ACP reductase FabG [Candidatus Hydrogenedentota bacterium]